MERALAVFNELMQTNSILKKKEILARNAGNADFRQLLRYLLDPFVITGISVKRLTKSVDIPPTSEFPSFQEVMAYVLVNNTGADQVISNLQHFLRSQPGELAELYGAIICKTLRIGCDVKTVNGVYGPDFISQWEVQQSFRFSPRSLEKGEWFAISEKVNGVRGTYHRGQLISRQGRAFEGLEHILTDLRRLPYERVVFDGELVRRNPEGVSDGENFRRGTGIINSADADKAGIEFVIFDLLPEEEFEMGESRLTYRDRLCMLADVDSAISATSLRSLRVVRRLYSGTDTSVIDRFLTEISDAGGEGVMLNRDTPYRAKRHNGILKVKAFYSVDLEVVGVKEGTGRLKGKLGAFVVSYKGNEVSVGSGMTDEQRERFFADRNQLIGRVIEVKYKQESRSKDTGRLSIQFPIFIALREEGKEVSYS